MDGILIAQQIVLYKQLYGIMVRKKQSLKLYIHEKRLLLTIKKVLECGMKRKLLAKKYIVLTIVG